MTLHLVLLIALILAALLAAMSRNFLYAAMWLASLSVTVTLIMFTMDASWAAVFELSVCAGLITVLFASTASLVGKGTKYAANERRLFKYLPVALLVFGVAVWYISSKAGLRLDITLPVVPQMAVGDYIWGANRLALLGQLCIFVAGVLMVKAFFLWRGK